MQAHLQRQITDKEVLTYVAARDLLNQNYSKWRSKWGVVVGGPSEYDIIARFSCFVLISIVVQRQEHAGKVDPPARDYCVDEAFEVCCSAIHHYKTWTGLLNSATFE